MNILYLSFWGISDVLTISTVFPTIQKVEKQSKVNKIILSTIERNKDEFDGKNIFSKTKILPWKAWSCIDFIQGLSILFIFPFYLRRVINKYDVEHILCRSSPAGMVGYLASKISGISFSVESFEPHSSYMIDNKIWTKNDIRFKISSYFEKKQIFHAENLICVSGNFKKYISHNFKRNHSVFIVPCSVDIQKFSFNQSCRTEIRRDLGICDDSKLVIYVGKFGGLYYEVETVNLINQFLCKKEFYALILSTQDLKSLKHNNKYIKQGKLFIRNVSHNEVPGFLSASDIALCPVRKTKSSLYCSPVKTGEYWANGLPVLMPDGIGDDSEIIKNNNGGYIVSFEKPLSENDFLRIDEIINEHNLSRNENIAVSHALKYRSEDSLLDCYNQIVNNL